MRTTIGIVAISVLALTGCGGSGSAHFANRPRPPFPINLTVYINDARVSVSPQSIGAGPVHLIVTNRARTAESLRVLALGAAPTDALADTGPINPQATAEVSVDVSNPGEYVVATATPGGSEAAVATPGSIQPASLHVGPPRPNATNQLLEP